MRFLETVGISHTLRLVDHAMKRRLDQILAKYKLTAAQYMALSALETKGRLTNAELARECSVTPQTSNRLIEGMVDAGLIKRSVDPEHARKLTLVLTKKAVTTICDAHIEVNQVELEALAGLSKGQINSVQDLMKTMLENLGEAEE